MNTEKDLKDIYYDYQNDTSLPPYNDDDAFFDEFTDSQKIAYLYQATKKALGMFYKQKSYNDILMREVLEIRQKVKILEKQLSRM